MEETSSRRGMRQGRPIEHGEDRRQRGDDEEGQPEGSGSTTPLKDLVKAYEKKIEEQGGKIADLEAALKDAVQEAFQVAKANKDSKNPVAPANGLLPLWISPEDLDLETLFLVITTARRENAEEQLRVEMDVVDKSNKEVEKLAALQSALNSINDRFSSSAQSGDAVGGEKEAECAAVREAARAAGITSLVDGGPNLQNFNGGFTKVQVADALNELKRRIDGLSNSNSLQMIRVQKWKNLFEEINQLMSAGVKDFADIVKGILRNMD